LSSSDLPHPLLTSAQAREADRLSQERYGVSADWLMEAAGWECARRCQGRTAVVAGTGNNGGDALAAARHLHRWGRLHSVACLDRGRLRDLAAARAEALERVGVAINPALELEGAETVLDGIFGIGLNRPVHGLPAAWIDAVNASGAHVVAIDVPSGIDADTGDVLGTAVRADLTVTFGFRKPALPGRVEVVDIGVPLEAYRDAGVAL
jgi:NAD(P)H-hydrate epimerase